MAQPSLLTAVTAILSAVASLSHGTTMAVTWPWPRAYSSIARDTTRGDPAVMNEIDMNVVLRISDCGLRNLNRDQQSLSQSAIRNPQSEFRNPQYARLARWSNQLEG